MHLLKGKHVRHLYLSGDIRVHEICTELLRVERETFQADNYSFISQFWVLVGQHLAFTQICMMSAVLRLDCLKLVYRDTPPTSATAGTPPTLATAGTPPTSATAGTSFGRENTRTAVQPVPCAHATVLAIRKRFPHGEHQIFHPQRVSRESRQYKLRCGSSVAGKCIQLPLTGRPADKRGTSPRLPAGYLAEVGPGSLQSHKSTTRQFFSIHRLETSPERLESCGRVDPLRWCGGAEIWLSLESGRCKDGVDYAYFRGQKVPFVSKAS